MAKGVIIKWNTQAVMSKVGDETERNMAKALRVAVNRCKQLISRGNITGKNPSLPGEPPKRQTGTLRSSIDSAIVREDDKVKGYLGVRQGPTGEGESNYGFILEVGTSKMKPRPFLRRTVSDNAGELSAIIKGKRK